MIFIKLRKVVRQTFDSWQWDPVKARALQRFRLCFVNTEFDSFARERDPPAQAARRVQRDEMKKSIKLEGKLHYWSL